MLTEERRKELDTIVQDMTNHKESDFNIRFVVDDFKKKYENETLQQEPTERELTDKILDNPLTRGIQKFFPGAKIGEAIGTQAAKLGLTGLTEEERKTVPPRPSAGQVAGDIANIGLTIAGVKGVGTVGSFGARLLKTIGLGAGLAGTKAISEGAETEDVLKSTALGGAIGAAIPIAGAGLRAAGRQIEQLPARFINSALSRSKKEVLQDIARDKVDDFAKYVIESKPVGTAKNLLSQSTDNVENLSKKVTSELASAIRKTGAKVTLGRDNLLDVVAKLPEAEGALLKRGDIKDIIEIYFKEDETQI